MSRTYSVMSQVLGEGPRRPWNQEGEWVLGGRDDQTMLNVTAASNDDGQMLGGEMTYAGEGPIGFRATLVSDNTYAVQNHWGLPYDPWNEAGTWVIGGRADKRVVTLRIATQDDGQTYYGEFAYAGEEPLRFHGKRLSGRD